MHRQYPYNSLCLCGKRCIYNLALNGLDVMMFNVGNAYLNASTTKKLYTVACKEFGVSIVQT
jgi:hypothetical protein